MNLRLILLKFRLRLIESVGQPILTDSNVAKIINFL